MSQSNKIAKAILFDCMHKLVQFKIMHNSQISFRKLDHTNASQYRAIRLACLKAHPQNFGSTYEEQNKLPQLMFEKALLQPVDDRFVMGAFDQHKLIGICGFVPKRSDYKHSPAHIPAHTGVCIQVYVKGTYSGKKIGLGLMQNMLAEAFKLTDIDQIILEVKEGNVNAIRVYEQAGFQTYTPAEVADDKTRHMIIHRIEWHQI